MRPPLQRAALAIAIVALPWTLAAQHEDSSGSVNAGDSDVLPTPSAGHHHRRSHLHGSPTPDSGTPAADGTPPEKRGHHLSQTEDASLITPSPSVASNAEDATPVPRHHHRYGYDASPSPAARNSSDDENAVPSVSPNSSKNRHHHRSVDAEDSSAVTSSPEPSASPVNETLDNASPTPRPHPSMAPDASLDPDDIQEYSDQSQHIQSLIESALELTRRNLTYTFSSDDPANGGMDCSGFIFYVLTHAGIKDVPRDASELYGWVRKAGKFRAVISRNLDGFEMDELKPGDLLFWSGTYKTDRDPPVTHVMIYLGREKSTGSRVMVGSSDGRSYHGQQRWGVSVFDFKATPESSPSQGRAAPRFIGYGSIPGF